MSQTVAIEMMPQPSIYSAAFLYRKKHGKNRQNDYDA